MHRTQVSRLYIPVLVFMPLVLVTLSCCPSVKLPAALRPDEGTEIPPPCSVPDLTGMDQEVARRKLIDLGLTPVKTEQHHDAIPVGLVVSLDPSPGTQLDPCQGEIAMSVSLGPSEQEEPTATPAPSATPEAAPPEDDFPLFFSLAYEEPFEEGFAGFRPEWGVDADPSNARANEYGELVTEGYVAAYVGDESWFNYHLTFGGADYSQIEQLFVMARTQDERNFVGMECFPSEGWLACEGHKVIDGQVQGAPGFQMTTRMCTLDQLQCDIVFEAIGDQFRVFVNGEQKAGFTDDTFTQGGVGFVVDGRWVLDYFEVLDPGGPASHSFTLFRDDFDTHTWSTGAMDDEYASANQTIADGKYHWELTAYQGVVFQELHELRLNSAPEDFPYHFSLSASAEVLSGSQGAAYGLLFRCEDHDNLYYFRVSQAGDAGLSASEGGEWIELVAPTHAAALQPGGRNELRVVAQGTRFSFWINGEFVFQASDDRHATGDIGLAAELMEQGDEMVIEFDDVRVGIAR